MAAQTPVVDKIIWDEPTGEPYLRVNETIRLTPVRNSDAAAWVCLLHF
jgi:hypothetical protein